MIFIETSVLVASFQDFHLNHTRSFSLVSKATPRTAFTSVHCVTEMFSVMTRMPPKFRASPELGFKFVRQIQTLLKIGDLDVNHTLAAVEELVERGLAGGIVYDALIMACARQEKPSAIYTLNKKHFDAVAPDLKRAIREP